MIWRPLEATGWKPPFICAGIAYSTISVLVFLSRQVLYMVSPQRRLLRLHANTRAAISRAKLESRQCSLFKRQTGEEEIKGEFSVRRLEK